MTDCIVILITCPSQEVASSLSSSLVKGSLAACVNIIPTIRSIYQWQGEICDDQETLMIVKTKMNMFEEIQSLVLKEHPYDVPEVISFPIHKGSQNYIQWIKESVR